MPLPTLTLSHPSLLIPYSLIIEDETLDSHLRTTLQKALERNITILHPDDRPVAHLDTDLANRVSALQAQASSLSAKLSKTRAEAVNSINATLKPRIEALNPPPVLTPQEPHHPSAHVLDPVAIAAACKHKNVAERVADVVKGVASTRKRAASVREVLKIISENKQLDADASKSIADDWTITFSDLRKKRPLQHEQPYDDSPVPLKKAREEDQVYLPISPHITPRSKMRKKLIRKNKSVVRQPTFSPLPR